MGSIFWNEEQLKRWKKELEEMFPNLPPYEAVLQTSDNTPNAMISDEEIHIRLQLKNTDSKVISIFAGFTLKRMPSANLLCSVSMYVADSAGGQSFRRRGIATELAWFKKRVAKEMGYAGLLATVSKHNKEEQGLLKKTHWKVLQEFEHFSLWSTFPE